MQLSCGSGQEACTLVPAHKSSGLHLPAQPPTLASCISPWRQLLNSFSIFPSLRSHLRYSLALSSLHPDHQQTPQSPANATNPSTYRAGGSGWCWSCGWEKACFCAVTVGSWSRAVAQWRGEAPSREDTCVQQSLSMWIVVCAAKSVSVYSRSHKHRFN